MSTPVTPKPRKFPAGRWGARHDLTRMKAGVSPQCAKGRHYNCFRLQCECACHKRAGKG